jgi:hypothetical protein
LTVNFEERYVGWMGGIQYQRGWNHGIKVCAQL